VNILVCAKRVPDTSDNDIVIDADRQDIEHDDLVFSVNEPDNYAVEEALQIVARTGGEVTVVTVGTDDDEEILRRELAMGAHHAALLCDDTFEGSDGRGVATILSAFVRKHTFDLILTGVQADDGAAQVGGMLAALLDYPFASLVCGIDVSGGNVLRITREVEGGNQEVSEIELPCVLSIQTGINEPRYVGMRGIRQAASVEIPRFGGTALDLAPHQVGAAAARVRRQDYFIPAVGCAAEMLKGSRDANVDTLIELLRSKGGLQR
jgi:electron transfer flavoprotein beta subunit